MFEYLKEKYPNCIDYTKNEEYTIVNLTNNKIFKTEFKHLPHISLVIYCINKYNWLYNDTIICINKNDYWVYDRNHNTWQFKLVD